MFGQKRMLTRIAITTLMASMLLVSAASAATIVPIGSTEMTFEGEVVVAGNLLDPAGLSINGILTLIDPVENGDPVFTLVIDRANGRGTVPKWTMFEESTVIGKGTMDDFTVIGAGAFVPPVILGLISTATYNGTGHVGPVSFPFSEVGTSTGDVEFGPGIVTWTGITVFAEADIPFPEPATMSLLCVGAVAMLRRKRHK